MVWSSSENERAIKEIEEGPTGYKRIGEDLSFATSGEDNAGRYDNRKVDRD